MLLRTAWSLLCFFSLLPQTAAPVPPAPEFHDADTDQKTGEVRFDAFQTVDWRQLAQRDLKDFNLKRPTPEQIAGLKKHLRDQPLEESGGFGEIQFVSPLETGMKRGFYYLLSGADLQPLPLLRLDGTMRYTLNAQKTAIVPNVFFGKIVAKPAVPPLEDAAFVVFSGSSLAFTALSGGSFSAEKVGKQDFYEYVRDGKKWSLSVPDEGLFEVMSSSSFKLGPSEFISVKWKPDTENHYGGCERQFSIFAVEQELRLVVSSLSGCDV